MKEIVLDYRPVRAVERMTKREMVEGVAFGVVFVVLVFGIISFA
jgi:hypothetical protein